MITIHVLPRRQLAECLWLHTWQFLTVGEIARLANVSKEWKRTLQSSDALWNALWKRVLQRDHWFRETWTRIIDVEPRFEHVQDMSLALMSSSSSMRIVNDSSSVLPGRLLFAANWQNLAQAAKQPIQNVREQEDRRIQDLWLVEEVRHIEWAFATWALIHDVLLHMVAPLLLILFGLLLGCRLLFSNTVQAWQMWLPLQVVLIVILFPSLIYDVWRSGRPGVTSGIWSLCVEAAHGARFLVIVGTVMVLYVVVMANIADVYGHVSLVAIVLPAVACLGEMWIAELCYWHVGAPFNARFLRLFLHPFLAWAGLLWIYTGSMLPLSIVTTIGQGVLFVTLYTPDRRPARFFVFMSLVVTMTAEFSIVARLLSLDRAITLVLVGATPWLLMATCVHAHTQITASTVQRERRRQACDAIVRDIGTRAEQCQVCTEVALRVEHAFRTV